MRPDGTLPPGVHAATWLEVEELFAQSPWRAYLFAGLCRAGDALAAAGCRRLWLDGSFVTGKTVPGDFDGCWDPTGVNPAQLDPVLLDFANQRAAQKAKYGGELFPASSAADRGGRTFVEFFQIDKTTSGPKGILQITLGSAP